MSKWPKVLEFIYRDSASGVLDGSGGSCDSPEGFVDTETNLFYKFTDVIIEPFLDNIDTILDAVQDPNKYNINVSDNTRKLYSISDLLKTNSNTATTYGGQILSQVVFTMYDYCPFTVLTSPSDPSFFYVGNYVSPHSMPSYHFKNCFRYDSGKIVRVGYADKALGKFVVLEDGYSSIHNIKTSITKTTLYISDLPSEYPFDVLPSINKEDAPSGTLAGINAASLKNKKLFTNDPPSNGIYMNPMTFSCSGVLRAVGPYALDSFARQLQRVCLFFGSRLAGTKYELAPLSVYKILDYNDPTVVASEG